MLKCIPENALLLYPSSGGKLEITEMPVSEAIQTVMSWIHRANGPAVGAVGK